MKIDVTTEGHKTRLAIVVPVEKVRAELDQAFRVLGRRVNMRGFRPGKAPRRVLEARFGPQVKADVAQSLIQSSYETALSEHEIRPIGRPSVDDAGDITSQQDFTFTISVDVKPEIVLETYKGVEVVFPKSEVGDDEVDTAAKARLEGEAKLVAISDRPARAGDMVLTELTARDGDEQVAFEQGTMIRTEADPYYSGAEALVIGLEVGGEKTGKVTFAEDARMPEVAGRELDVTVKVHAIQAQEVPELTDALATELGYEGGVEGMRAALRMELGGDREEAARNQARANLLEKLIEVNPFEVPAGLTDTSLNMLLDELKAQQAYATGRDPRTITFPETQLADLRNRAQFAAKAGLILEFVAKAENIEVTDDDREARYRMLADGRGQTVEAVRGMFSKEPGAVDELNDRLLEEKTLDWLLEQAEIVDPPEVDQDAAEAASEE